MSQVHIAGGDITTDQVRIPAFERRGRRDGSGENAIAEAGSETLNLTLHWLEAIGRASVRNVTIRPCGVVACGSTGGVEEGWLDEQDERSVGGELALRCDDLLERTSEVDGSSA